MRHTGYILICVFAALILPIKIFGFFAPLLDNKYTNSTPFGVKHNAKNDIKILPPPAGFNQPENRQLNGTPLVDEGQNSAKTASGAAQGPQNLSKKSNYFLIAAVIIFAFFAVFIFLLKKFFVKKNQKQSRKSDEKNGDYYKI